MSECCDERLGNENNSVIQFFKSKKWKDFENNFFVCNIKYLEIECMSLEIYLQNSEFYKRKLVFIH